MTDDPSVWYFAYGSNLDPKTFLERRRMQPLAVRRGYARGHRLTFDLPIGPGERGVANLVPDAAATTWGVAYQITTAQGTWLDRTEGVPQGAYRRITVDVSAHEGGGLEAFTYTSPHRAAGRKPSARYLDIVLAGARHHGLPADWIDWLESHERAIDERAET